MFWYMEHTASTKSNTSENKDRPKTGFTFSAENENGAENELSFSARNRNENENCLSFSAENENENKYFKWEHFQHVITACFL